MTPGKREIIAITMLLKRPRPIDLETAQRSAEFAFRGAPQPPKVVAIPDKPAFGVLLGPLRLGIISASQPYFKDIAKIADRVPNVAGRMAIQQHTAWISVDLMGEPPPIERATVYGLIGSLIAELLKDDVLGLIRMPDGPVIGYDYSFIPLFRNRKATDVFRLGTPDRIVKASANSEALAAAAAEARRRWPEFVTAFANKYPGQGFGVKKKFVDGKQVEHMWIEVASINGSTIRGSLSNSPGILKALKLGSPVVMSAEDVEDWMFTNGNSNVGGFQAKVLQQGQ